MRVDILLICRKHLHNLIINQEGVLFGVSMLPVSKIILFDFGIVFTMCYFLFFISLYIGPILPFIDSYWYREQYHDRQTALGSWYGAEEMILPEPLAREILFPLVCTTTLGQSVYSDIALHISNNYINIIPELCLWLEYTWIVGNDEPVVKERRK